MMSNLNAPPGSDAMVSSSQWMVMTMGKPVFFEPVVIADPPEVRLVSEAISLLLRDAIVSQALPPRSWQGDTEGVWQKGYFPPAFTMAEEFRSPIPVAKTVPTTTQALTINAPATGSVSEAERVAKDSGKSIALSAIPAAAGDRVNFLAELHPDVLLNEAALARGFGVSRKTVQRWVLAYILPPCDPQLRLWRVGRILDWINARAQRVEEPAWNYWLQLKDLE